MSNVSPLTIAVGAGVAVAGAAYFYHASKGTKNVMNTIPDVAKPLVPIAVKLYQKEFGANTKAGKLIASCAPGRVNLIGEHTDYNDGFVFPMAIERVTVFVGAPNGLNVYRIVSSGAKHAKTFTYEQLMAIPTAHPTWDAYVRGVVAQYAKRGQIAPPFDVAVVGNVPLGGGLSSSASLEVATATFVDQLLGITTSDKDKALMSQAAEHEYAKMPCGVMDQFISVFGKTGHALLVDCRSLDTKLVPLADPNVVVLITNSHVKHQLNTGEYAIRRKQCEAAVAVLKRNKPSIKALRDATMEDLKAAKMQMDPVVYKRARHVITENARCLAAAKALEAGDFSAMGKLMNASHDSLRDDYAVSCSEIDVLVDLARHQPGVFGSRITGGGFGGCTVTLVSAANASAAQAAIERGYQAAVGKRCSFLLSKPGEGACAFKLPAVPLSKL